MPKFSLQLRFGFTLLETLLAMGIALILAAVAVPAVSKGFDANASGPFAKLDAMAREARERSVNERRAYVIGWEDEGVLRLRPEFPANGGEAQGGRCWKMGKGEKVTVEFPSALGAAGQPLMWTFWPDGTREAARVRYRAGKEAWMASYDSVSSNGKVRHD